MASLDDFLAQAKSLTQPAYEQLAASTQEAAQKQRDIQYSLAATTEAQIPVIQQTYKALGEELSSEQKVETGFAEKAGEQNIGGARAALASAGIEGATGAFAAPVTAAQTEFAKNVSDIANKYQVKKETLAQESESAVSDIMTKAQSYRAQGDTIMSQALVDVAKVKLDAQESELSTAKTLYSEYMSNIREQMSVAASDRASTASERASQSQLLAEMNKWKAVKQSVDTKGEGGSGYNFYDASGSPTTAGEYFTVKGGGDLDVDLMATTFKSSDNPMDRQIAANIIAMKNSGWEPTAIENQLKRDYPHLF